MLSFNKPSYFQQLQGGAENFLGGRFSKILMFGYLIRFSEVGWYILLLTPLEIFTHDILKCKQTAVIGLRKCIAQT